MRVERPGPSANVRRCVPTPAGHTRAELFEASHQETATDLADHAALRPTQERRIERPRAQVAITCASAVNAPIRRVWRGVRNQLSPSRTPRQTQSAPRSSAASFVSLHPSASHDGNVRVKVPADTVRARPPDPDAK